MINLALLLFTTIVICETSKTSEELQKLRLVVLGFKNLSSYKGELDIEKGLSEMLIARLAKSKRYELVVPDENSLSEINRQIRVLAEKRKKHISEYSAQHLAYICSFFDADMVVMCRIENFEIKRFAFLNPKIGGYGNYIVNIEFTLKLANDKGFYKKHKISSEKTGKKDVRTIFTDGIFWSEEMPCFDEYSKLIEMEFGSEQFKETRLGTTISELLDKIVTKIEKTAK